MKIKRPRIVTIWVATALIIAGIIVLSLVSKRVMLRNTAEAFNRQQLFLVREAARGIARSVSSLNAALETAADLLDEAGAGPVLEAFSLRSDHSILSLLLVDGAGAVVAGCPHEPAELATLAEQLRPFILRAHARQQQRFTTDIMPFTIAGTRTLSFVLGVAMPGGKRWLCCLTDFDTVKQEFVYPIRTGATGYAWMIDSSGVLLAHPNAAMEGRKALDVLHELWPEYSAYNLEVIINREMTRGVEGKGEYTGWHIGEKKLTRKLVAYSPIQVPGVLWSIGVAAPYAEVLAPLRESIGGPTVFTAAFIAILLVLAWLLTLQENRQYRARQELTWSQEVFDGIGDGISIIDRDYRVLMVNRAVCQWQGRSQEFFKAKPCYRVFQGQETLCVGCPARETFETGQPAFRERVSTTVGGKKYYFHLSTFPLKDDTGTTVRVAECVKDVTREMELRQELLQHERKSVIVKMASQVAHEIRNPLGSLTLNIDLLEDEISGFAGVDAGEARQLLGTIKNEIEGLHRVLQEYLECTRFPTIKPELHDIAGTVEALFAFLEEELRRRKIVFTSAFEYDLPPAWIDQDQIRRALLNIVQNAIEAIGTGGTISVSAASEGDVIVLTVADSGPGMAPEQVEKIFTPFFTTKSGGTGLGLAITHHIVSEHKGTISCESAPGAGTRFIIRLPARRQNSDSEE